MGTAKKLQNRKTATSVYILIRCVIVGVFILSETNVLYLLGGRFCPFCGQFMWVGGETGIRVGVRDWKAVVSGCGGGGLVYVAGGGGKARK